VQCKILEQANVVSGKYYFSLAVSFWRPQLIPCSIYYLSSPLQTIYHEKLAWWLSVAFISCFLCPVCSPEVVKVSPNSVLTLSDDFANANTAEGKCQKLGGHLVSFIEGMTRTIFKDALTRYTKGKRQFTDTMQGNFNFHFILGIKILKAVSSCCLN